MISRNILSHSKITVIFLMTVSLYCSCSNIDLTPTSAKNSAENDANSPKTGFEEKTISPLQSKARRHVINFPEDCQFFPNQSSKDWELQLACAQTLDAVLPNLPDAGCQYESFKKDSGRFNEVVDDSKILIHTIQEADVDDLENLAKTLETTKENIVSLNNLDSSAKLSIGQELKYQKSHLQKSDTNWFDGYDVVFYSLSTNTYLVKVRCILGAYNELNVYLLYDESQLPAKAQVIDFPSLEIQHNKDSDVAVNVEKIMTKTIGGRWFNPKTKQLIVFVKAHGIGDAGHYARYSFQDGKPKLEEFRAKFVWQGREYTLDDVIKNPPKTWKRYYP